MKQYIFINVFIFFISLFTLQIGLGYAFMQYSYMNNTRASLNSFAERVKADLEFKDGKWIIDKYLADPQTPHPQGSSGFTNPLYIIATDGFVIERNLPIHGFLDVSDYKHLMTFIKPSFVSGGTNEQWRVVSVPIMHDNESQGVITVASYNPLENTVEQTDGKLQTISADLLNKISYIDNTIDISHIDIRNIKYDVSFEIVSKYNKVLLNNGRTPSFIDKSYVYEALSEKERIVKDAVTQKQYIVRFYPLLDDQQKPRAVIIAGENLDTLNTSLKNYLFSSILLTIIILFPLTLILTSFTYRWINKGIHIETEKVKKKEQQLPERIFFDKKNSTIIADNKQVKIPYASNQYYLVLALFGTPNKRWEIDELLEKMGASLETNTPRTIYDAALALNKKFSWKLIEYDKKTYRMNPQLLSSLQ